MCWKGATAEAVRTRKGFTLLTLNEGMDNINRIIKQIKNPGVLTDGATRG